MAVPDGQDVVPEGIMHTTPMLELVTVTVTVVV